MGTFALQHADANRSQAVDRVQTIEAVRIIAAFGIVVFHAGSSLREFGYGGLVVFLILAPMLELGMKGDRRRNMRELLLGLMVPWALWSIIYGAAHLAAGKPVMETGMNPLSLLVGTAIHLWFLPFLFLTLLVLGRVKGRVAAAMLFWPAAIGASVLLASASLWFPAVAGWPPPLSQWIHASPALLLGIALGSMSKIGRRSALTGLAPIAAALIWLCLSPVKDMTIPYVVGCLAIALALWLAPMGHRLGLRVQAVASCMMGVYLMHVLALAALRRIVGDDGLVLPLSAFAVSLAVTYMLQRFIPHAELLVGKRPGKPRTAAPATIPV